MTHLTEHFIDVQSHLSIKQSDYTVSFEVHEGILADLDAMLSDDIVDPSNSGWSTPIVMVRKLDGSDRFCLDFRKLNKVTKQDAHPLPKMENILEKLRSAKYISTMDIQKGFLQVALEKESGDKTAFSVPGRGLFHFKRMPFGLTNAPATFQRLVDSLIGAEMEPHVFAYLDEIILIMETFEDHLK